MSVSFFLDSWFLVFSSVLPLFSSVFVLFLCFSVVYSLFYRFINK